MDILWEKSLQIIKEKVSQQNFETWIMPIKISSMEGNNITLNVPNKFFKDWLIENYHSVIKETLTSLAGIDLKVDLQIAQEIKKSQSSVRRHGEHPEKTRTPIKSVRSGINHSLNPHYSFERFVVGPCNQFAHAASVAVAEQPAKNYNPLFIYGGVGLGKTHLLNAIGFHALSLHKDMNVVYVSAEEFMNELINSIRYDRMPKFREKYRNIDCLLIDDIQFMAGKERTQEEFFHTFNTLHDSGKQIVVTSDKFPKDIPNLESRLRSRFEWGLIADIQPPEIETKIAIIEKKAQENNVVLPHNVAYYVASHVESNIRELEGYLIRISAFSSLTGKEIDLNLTKEVLKKILKRNEKEDVTIEEILKTVAGKLNIKLSDIKSQKKNKNLVLSRQIAMYLSRKMTASSFPDIGEKIGGRDHSTVIYANNKMKKALEEDTTLKKIIQDIEETLLNKA
ncbi:MAG: chromosomal replication initiator protein DnaA [Deltaproteobacteria bacterium]|nr:chromosomal replication initiator protein DnaA [Deltaproteobacteria bacterium]